MNEKLPLEVSCPYCETVLELEDKEREKEKFTCPHCNKEVTSLEIKHEHIMEKENSKLPFAGFWIRFASISIDIVFISLILLTVNIFIFSILHFVVSTDLSLRLFLFLIIPLNLLVASFYYVWFNSNGRQTLGKIFFGLLVVDVEEKSISLRRSVFRTILFNIDSVFASIGHLLILFTEKKQTFHDLITRTYVVHVKKPKEKEKIIIFLVILAALILQLTLNELMKTYVAAYRIPTSAMENTLLVGDFIFVYKYGPFSYYPEPGDLVVFKYPWNPDLMRYPEDPNYEYVKRCVAVSGQTLEIKDKILWVDGEQFPIPPTLKHADPNMFSRYNQNYPIFRPGLGSRDNFGPLTVPANHYFMLGDNRDNSSDSRDWGFVPQENIIGKAGIVYLSWNSKIPSYRLLKKVRWSRLGKLIE